MKLFVLQKEMKKRRRKEKSVGKNGKEMNCEKKREIIRTKEEKRNITQEFKRNRYQVKHFCVEKEMKKKIYKKEGKEKMEKQVRAEEIK